MQRKLSKHCLFLSCIQFEPVVSEDTPEFFSPVPTCQSESSVTSSGTYYTAKESNDTSYYTAQEDLSQTLSLSLSQRLSQEVDDVFSVPTKADRTNQFSFDELEDMEDEREKTPTNEAQSSQVVLQTEEVTQTVKTERNEMHLIIETTPKEVWLVCVHVISSY